MGKIIIPWLSLTTKASEDEDKDQWNCKSRWFRLNKLMANISNEKLFTFLMQISAIHMKQEKRALNIALSMIINHGMLHTLIYVDE